MFFNVGLTNSKLLKQKQDISSYTHINSIESSLYGYIKDIINVNYISISITENIVSTESSITPNIINNNYFIYNNNSINYLYQWINNESVLITNQSYCNINNILYYVDNSGIMNIISDNVFIYFAKDNYYIITTSNGNINNYTPNTLQPPYIIFPKLLNVGNFDNTINYPLDNSNNTLLIYNNNIININDDTTISLNKHNFITNNNYYVNGSTSNFESIPTYQLHTSNLVPGGTFTCYDGIYIRDITNNKWNNILYNTSC